MDHWQKSIIIIYNPGSININFLSSELYVKKEGLTSLALNKYVYEVLIHKYIPDNCKYYATLVCTAQIVLRETISRSSTSIILFLKIVWNMLVFTISFATLLGGGRNHCAFQIFFAFLALARGTKNFLDDKLK